MTRTTKAPCAILALAIVWASAVVAQEFASTTSFTYRGELRRGGRVANGTYDLEIRLYDQPVDGTLLGTVDLPRVEVADGNFSVELDFGLSRAACSRQWLEIAVKQPESERMTLLLPRQPLLAKAGCAVDGDLAVTGEFSAIGISTEDATVSGSSSGPNFIAGTGLNLVLPGAAGCMVGGGEALSSNAAYDNYCTVSGGHANEAGIADSVFSNGRAATVGGGGANHAAGQYSTVSGGGNNEASGQFATVPGGSDNEATGDYSVAAGRRAKALHDGSIILADSSNFDFSSVVANAFRVRATGGIRFVLGIDGSGNMAWNCLVNDGSSWSCTSDRNLKENMRPVDGAEVLEQLEQVPIFTWNGKGRDPAVRHVGPTAQDFSAAFGLGADDTHIATIDLDGIALAAIKQLAAENRDLQAQLAALEARLAALESRGDTQSAGVSTQK